MCFCDIADMNEEEKNVMFEVQMNPNNPACRHCSRTMIAGNHISHCCFVCPACGNTDGCSGENIAEVAVSACKDCRAPIFKNGLCYHSEDCGHDIKVPRIIDDRIVC